MSLIRFSLSLSSVPLQLHNLGQVIVSLHLPSGNHKASLKMSPAVFSTSYWKHQVPYYVYLSSSCSFCWKGLYSYQRVTKKEVMLELFLIVPTFWSNKYPILHPLQVILKVLLWDLVWVDVMSLSSLMICTYA